MTDINRFTIDIPQLVADIKAGETAWKADIKAKDWTRGNWKAFAMDHGLSEFEPANGLTKLYTLRAWVRGKLHRQTPPASIRDFNRSMVEAGHPQHAKPWSSHKHNGDIARALAGRYERAEPAPDPNAMSSQIAAGIAEALAQRNPGHSASAYGGTVTISASE
jgi:hypothetical protein